MRFSTEHPAAGPLNSGVRPHMICLRVLVAILAPCAAVGCASVSSGQSSQLSRCASPSAPIALVSARAEGVTLALPSSARGPRYDSDDYLRSRPTWEGADWYVHLVYGNGGLTRYMEGAHCCTLNDAEMRRKVCVGSYIRYGAMADISRTETPKKVSSMQVTIGPDGLTEAEALSVIGSAVTNWEHR